MKNVRKLAVGLGVSALLVVGWVAPQTSAEAVAPMGYTVIAGDGSCDLATLDLVTGTLTDLPAASSAEACAIDLAAAPDGTVYGIGDRQLRRPSASTATWPRPPRSAPSSPTPPTAPPRTTPIVVEDGTDGGIVYGGIAVSASGTIYVHLVDRRARLRHRRPEPEHHPPGRRPAVRRRLRVPLHPRRRHRRGHPGGHHRPVPDALLRPHLVRRAHHHRRPRRRTAEWGTESTSTGEVTVGAAVAEVPLGYDCDSTAGGPLWSLQSPNGGIVTAQASEVTINTVDPATGALTEIVPVSDSAADLMALAVVPTAARPTPIDVANANDVAPAFTG